MDHFCDNPKKILYFTGPETLLITDIGYLGLRLIFDWKLQKQSNSYWCVFQFTAWIIFICHWLHLYNGCFCWFIVFFGGGGSDIALCISGPNSSFLISWRWTSLTTLNGSQTTGICWSKPDKSTLSHLELHAKADIPVYLCVCVCVCVWIEVCSFTSTWCGVFQSFVLGILSMALSGLKLHALSSTQFDALRTLS